MIFFKSIKFKNFLSTGNYFTEINLSGNSNTLVIGTNGAGKSTMLDALCFVLFGKAFRNINKPQLINSINQKDCVVECEFRIGKREYKIVRGIKPAVFEIYLDGQLLNQEAASKDYQEILEKQILKLNYKSFTQIVILGSASFVPFMQLSAADRRAIIEDLLDIQIFSTMNNILKDKISVNKEEIQANKHSAELTKTKYDMQKDHIEKLSKSNDELILEKKEQIDSAKSDIEKTQKVIDSISSEIESLTNEILDKDTTEKKHKKLFQFETQIETNLSSYKKNLKFYHEKDDCPTCQQLIQPEFKKEQIKALTEKIQKSEDGLEKLSKEIEDYQNKLNRFKKISDSIQLKQVHIASNTMTVVETTKYIERLTKEYLSLTSAKQDLEKEVVKLDELKTELLSLEQKKQELIEQKTYYETASLLLKDTGIKTKIIRQYLPVINKLVNKYLSSLDFFVNFNLDESFKETIKSRHRDEFSYSSFSEGEKQRIDMALMLTWRAVAKLKNSANTNLLILDEVFDSSLDNNGTEYLMQILNMLEDVNLFVISHKGDILQDKFRNIIRFEKVNNFSRIVK
jgi:DNA repair exonuclease SbcCD ATPase subunit